MNKYFLGLLIIVLGFYIYIYFKESKIQNEVYIHSSKYRGVFLINSYNDEKISEIQLSLNKRDNKYKIVLEDNNYKLYKKDLIEDVLNVVNYSQYIQLFPNCQCFKAYDLIFCIGN